VVLRSEYRRRFPPSPFAKSAVAGGVRLGDGRLGGMAGVREWVYERLIVRFVTRTCMRCAHAFGFQEVLHKKRETQKARLSRKQERLCMKKDAAYSLQYDVTPVRRILA
jgi:hypothetical protein